MTKILIRGVVYAMIADMLWGLAFIVPKLLPAYSAIEIILGRYTIFGTISIILLLNEKNKTYKLTGGICVKALILALCGNIGYYFFLVIALQQIGVTRATLINGILPVSISLYGNWLNREYPLKKILLPVTIMLGGIMTINLAAYGSGIGKWNAAGIISGIVAVLLWTWYGVANARFLKENPNISSESWATITGIASLCLLPLFLLFVNFTMSEPASVWRIFILNKSVLTFWLGCSVLGIIVSWFAYGYWNKASQILPVSLAGQLIVGETVFGLFYSFLIAGRIPSMVELIGIILAIGGILLFIRTISRSPGNSNEIGCEGRCD